MQHKISLPNSPTVKQMDIEENSPLNVKKVLQNIKQHTHISTNTTKNITH